MEFTRNKLRHDLLPVLRGYNPRVDDALERISRITRESVTYLEREVSRLWPSIVKGNDRFLVVNSIILSKQAAVIQKIILRRVYATVAGDVCGLEEKFWMILWWYGTFSDRDFLLMTQLSNCF